MANLSPSESLHRLSKRGWQHLDTRFQETNNPEYQMLKPGTKAPVWLRAGALKALALHTL